MSKRKRGQRQRPGMLFIRHSHRPAIVIDREALRAEKLVYVAVANRAFRYPRGRSAIAYIGTTKRGAARIASSAAHKAKLLLKRGGGLKNLKFYIVTCSARPGTQAWARLERALLIAFKYEFGAPPIANRLGKNFEPTDEYRFFRHARLRAVIEHFNNVR